VCNESKTLSIERGIPARESTRNQVSDDRVSANVSLNNRRNMYFLNFVSHLFLNNLLSSLAFCEVKSVCRYSSIYIYIYICICICTHVHEVRSFYFINNQGKRARARVLSTLFRFFPTPMQREHITLKRKQCSERSIKIYFRIEEYQGYACVYSI